ncbi:MAG: sigma-54-dependent Fis family transcriptional regulator [Desulfomonile tiedjei]|uniref:Sigma-54-dependent Fis family transcriptional regulator n=1 Tax=Desulfomonile tiedjei TaxID=2358 RepID=A0A9D6V017_9BACT|nr:sigma-54-dependent Fis family transcriptional regulator [Desulfomonile tiedjei]
MAGTILIVDDDAQVVRHLEYLLRAEGYQVAGAHNAAEVRRTIRVFFPDVVLLDLKLPDADGLTLMTEIREIHPSARYLIMTAYGSIRSAVEATRLGASDYMTKPVDMDELLISLRNAMRERIRDEEVRLLRKAYRPPHTSRPTRPVSEQAIHDYPSEAMRSTLQKARQAAAGDSVVLLLGESGTGKDYLARFIHNHSSRADGPFFAINCAAVSPELAESELFGHEPGAFTGARGRKRGLLELAERGTLLLNEIGELSPELQAKLLTFLDTRSFTRVGGEVSIPVDARLIAATNRDLQKEVAEGRFRTDLFYRLNVLSIRVPLLCERVQDIPVLAREIIAQLVAEMDLSHIPEVDAASMTALANYSWPGNVRELRNVIERSLMLSSGGTMSVAALDLTECRTDWLYRLRFPENRSLNEVIEEAKRAVIVEALCRSAGKRQAAARLLGISRNALFHHMKSLGIDA